MLIFRLADFKAITALIQLICTRESSSVADSQNGTTAAVHNGHLRVSCDTAYCKKVMKYDFAVVNWGVL